MRTILILAMVTLTGCGYGFTFHPEDMTPDQMLQRAELVFVGVVEGQHLDSWPFFRVPMTDSAVRGLGSFTWRPVRRRVRVETVLRGTYSSKEIDVYEVWGGAASNTNQLLNNQRYLFLVRQQNGRWQNVRDYFRSIYKVNTGYHPRLPFGESRPFWERYALMNYWISADQDWSSEQGELDFSAVDPTHRFSWWREVKLRRGLLSHPQRKIRLAACSQLVGMGWGQDECQDAYGSNWTRRNLTAQDYLQLRNNFEWDLFALGLPPTDPRSQPSSEMEELRILTTINHPGLRREFCRKFMAKFPNDSDNGCPADKPPPATIVTENGDVPLVGKWPTLTTMSLPGR